MAYYQQIRQQQIGQLFQFFQGTVLLERSAEKEDYRVPIMFSRSQNPLFIKVGVSYKFPQTAPTITLMHKVTHEKIDPVTFAYKSDLLNNWGAHSSLLTLLRQLSSEFELQAPVNQA